MGGEPNQAFWRGIRPTDPAENIPVDIKVCSVTLPVGIASIIGNMPVDVKAHTVNTPVDVKSHAVNTPVDVKSMTGNMPVDIKAHTVNTPVDIKSHDVDTPVKNSWVLQNSILTYETNPLNAAIYSDSGQLTEGWYDFNLSFSCTVDHSCMRLQHRNAANDDSLHVWHFMLLGYAPHEIKISNWYIAANERMRMQQVADITGMVVGNLWWAKRT